MLENKPPSRLGSYIIIGVLMVILCFFIYETADYKQAYKWRGVEINFQNEKIENLKKAAKEINDIAKHYYMTAVQYQKIFDRSITIPKDSVISVKKGTIVIPPMPQEKAPEVQ